MDDAVEPDGWCTPAAGQDPAEFIDAFVASRAPLSDAEIMALRTVIRPILAAQEDPGAAAA